MAAIPQTWRRVIGRRSRVSAPTARVQAEQVVADAMSTEIAPNDPLLAYFEGVTGAVELDALQLQSPACEALRAAGVKLIVPLVSQGELIGLLNLGERLSEQEYSSDDRKLLENLASQAAPALRVAQLVREQEAEARERERIEQELQVARLIQQNFLPKQLPELPGWHVAALYRPARAVGGDFYDFIDLPEQQVGIVIGDVSGKGVPAALVMAATRALLRASAPRLVGPGAVLARVNELLCPDTPPNMFVTCLYAVLDPSTGHLQYANAGHDVPYVRTSMGVAELRARGMPLGLMPGTHYEEREAHLGIGDEVLFHSDGVVESHAPDGEMFGFPRLKELIHTLAGDTAMIPFVIRELERFTGPAWEQEDDVTLVTIRRDSVDASIAPPADERVLAEFSLPSVPGNERDALERVAEVVQDLGLAPKRLERLKTAVAEATMNAIEHGNANRAELAVEIRIAVSGDRLVVRITDQGGERPIIEEEAPDLEAKLTGLQRPRGWGLFLIKNMIDEIHINSDATHHAIDLVVDLAQGGDN